MLVFVLRFSLTFCDLILLLEAGMCDSLLSLVSGEGVLSLDTWPETRDIEPRGDMVCGAEGDLERGMVLQEVRLPRGLSHCLECDWLIDVT